MAIFLKLLFMFHQYVIFDKIVDMLWFLLLALPFVSLKEEVPKAQKGDYIVYGYKESLVLVRVKENTPPILTIEEISAPRSCIESNWQEWLKNNAPGHTSWTVSRINIKEDKVESVYSVDDKEYVNSNPAFQFLPTLFRLHLTPIEAIDRKLIGPPPAPGEPDFRKLWLPKIVYEGKEIHPQLLAYRVRWPKDDSELSDRLIDVYIPQNGALTYFPYWIEVFAGLGKAKIMAIDSGREQP